MQRTSRPGGKRAMKLAQQQLPQGLEPSSKRQRFWPCPVCNRSFALYFLEDHVNQCLDSALSPSPTSSNTDECRITGKCESSLLVLPGCCNSAACAPWAPPLPEEDEETPVTVEIGSNSLAALDPISIRGRSGTTESILPLSVCLSPSRSVNPTTIRSTNDTTSEANCCRHVSSSASDACVDRKIDSSALKGATDGRRPAISSSSEICMCRGSQLLAEAVGNEDSELLPIEAEKAQPSDKSELSGTTGVDGLGIDISPQASCPIDESRVQIPGTSDAKDGVFEKRSREVRDGEGRPMERPPAGFKLFQKQVQSQARLSMFSRFSTSAPLERKRTVTVLQPGMVLFRSWLELEIQQKLVHESQSVAHLFRRPTTSGGGKYHIYSMCWGPKVETKTLRYSSEGPEHLLPDWMFLLSQKLARDAQQHTSVYRSDSVFTPDVGLVNFYPVKADELGVIGIGGHQDLEGNRLTPVVSVSVGDSMTFFYRRFPPKSRRKSGVKVSVDEEAAIYCGDGDVAHNREHKILLESGDVLVFGGQSRLVYHGTRHVLPGTRPPGLHMVPGRLNFTFRQT